MSFLDSLASSLNESMGIAENTPTGLDTSKESFGALGNFANKIDKTAQRQYVESGTIRNIRPRASEIIMQEPDLTVLIKKRQFSSLVENYRYDLMNSEEKLFIRATKRLFYNKCRAIAAYERLSKMDRIAKAGGFINDNALPQLFGALDSLTALGINVVDAKTQATLETVRKIKALSDPNFVTTWIVDRELPYVTDTGEGTGVFELTTVAQMDCTNSVMLGGGSASLTIEDPYKMMIISNEDIDRAISDATGSLSTNNFFRLAETGLESTINEMKLVLNSLRTARGAVAIKFLLNESSLQFKKVRAIIDEEGREINFSFDGGFLGFDSSVSIDSSAFVGVNGLATSRPNSKSIAGPFATSTETELFKQIITNIFQLIGLQQSSANAIKNWNKETSYVRRKMRLHYGNKPMIQPMDVVHVFIGSKTTTDERLTRGLTSLFSSSSVMNKLNDAAGNIESAYNDLKETLGAGNAADSDLEIEKNAIAGSEFPTWLWTMMRNDFTRQAAGTHVFAGVIDGASHNYDSGKYTLRVTAKDNSYYFKFSQTNINPSVSVFNSALYDPITPFKLDFDASSGFLRGEIPPLLEENVRLLNSGAIRSKNGPFRGAPLSEALWKMQNTEPTPNGKFRQKFYDPDGFVYRWKEGIGSLIWSGEPHSSLKLGSFASESSININKDPFSGQDVMNVLSLLITGTPYNFNTFMRASIAGSQLSRDELNNEDLSASFFRGLISDISKQNATWGNFVPFKKMIINEKGYNFLRSGEFDIVNRNARLNLLLRERAKSFDQLITMIPEFANSPQFHKIGAGGALTIDASTGGNYDVNGLATLGTDIIKLDFQIASEKKAFQDDVYNGNNINSSEGGLRIFGDDVSFDPTVTDDPNPVTESQRISQRNEFRKKINNLTQRRLWKVKGNEDPNLFIVDDSYDKNYDIQAFERSLAGKPELFNSTYTTIFERLEPIAKMLGLEVFANSQGHIEARPPQYNRMPSSVFYKMIQEKEKKGIQLFPDFLESLFFNQVQGLTDQLEIVEDEIRIRAAALGFTNDAEAENILKGTIALGDASFSFITNQTDGRVGGEDLRKLILQASPDLTADAVPGALKELTGKLHGALKNGGLFDIASRTEVVNEKKFGGDEVAINKAITAIGNRLKAKKDEPAPTRGTLLSNDRTISGHGRSQLDIVALSEDIAKFVSERQYVVKLLANALKNLEQGITINRDKDPSTNFLFPYLNKKKSDMFPEILEHMIEDEDNDDYGPGSGGRYVLTDSKIINLSIAEKPPDWTVVQVNGRATSQGPPPSLEKVGLGDGGNMVVSAYSVDYDMWRMYGFRSQHAATVEFFTDPVTQCAPYGVFLLNEARKKIFQGSATVVGNEYIQPGEVYYIEDRDLLFYAESVSHSFSYSGSFTTSLNLTFGHNPGEYIPTQLDIIGKGLYTNRHQASLARHIRHGNANGDTHLNVLLLNLGSEAPVDGVNSLIASTFGDHNRKALNNMMVAAAGLMNPTTLGQKVNIELRTYSHSDLDQITSPDLIKAAEAVKQWILNPTQTSISGPASETPILPDNKAKPLIDKKYIKTVPVDLATDDNGKSPSSQAWNMARTISLNNLNSKGQSLTTTDGELDAKKLEKQDLVSLTSNVIDLWISFEDADEPTVGSANASKPVLSESDAAAEKKAIDAFLARLGKVE